MKDGLLDRYPAHRRELPLRRTADPCAGRVAEVTLEQTQVARVVPRYEGGRGKGEAERRQLLEDLLSAESAHLADDRFRVWSSLAPASAPAT